MNHHHDHNHDHEHEFTLTVDIWQHEIKAFIEADIAKLAKLALEGYVQQGRGFIYVKTTPQDNGIIEYDVSYQGYGGVAQLANTIPDIKQRVYDYDPKSAFVLFAADISLDVHEVMTIQLQNKSDEG